MKIAFATSDNKTVDEHFGRSHAFAVYDVTPDGFELHEIRELGTGSGEDEISRIDSRVEVIKDCTVLYCADIGPGAASRVVRQRIHPMRVSSPEMIDDVLKMFVGVLKNPPIWLRRILEREA